MTNSSTISNQLTDSCQAIKPTFVATLVLMSVCDAWYYLLVQLRGVQNKGGERLYDFPGGLVEDGEDPLDGAKRELSEEAPLYSTSELTCIFEQHKAKSNFKLYMCIVDPKVNEENDIIWEGKLCTEETDFYRWIPFNPNWPEIPYALRRCCTRTIRHLCLIRYLPPNYIPPVGKEQEYLFPEDMPMCVLYVHPTQLWNPQFMTYKSACSILKIMRTPDFWVLPVTSLRCCKYVGDDCKSLHSILTVDDQHWHYRESSCWVNMMTYETFTECIV